MEYKRHIPPSPAFASFQINLLHRNGGHIFTRNDSKKTPIDSFIARLSSSTIAEGSPLYEPSGSLIMLGVDLLLSKQGYHCMKRGDVELFIRPVTASKRTAPSGCSLMDFIVQIHGKGLNFYDFFRCSFHIFSSLN